MNSIFVDDLHRVLIRRQLAMITIVNYCRGILHYIIIIVQSNDKVFDENSFAELVVHIIVSIHYYQTLRQPNHRIKVILLLLLLPNTMFVVL